MATQAVNGLIAQQKAVIPGCKATVVNTKQAKKSRCGECEEGNRASHGSQIAGCHHVLKAHGGASSHVLALHRWLLAITLPAHDESDGRQRGVRTSRLAWKRWLTIRQGPACCR